MFSVVCFILFQPCNVRNWELQVTFKIHGKGKDLFGDGMVIWYAKERMVPGPVFGSKDYFSGLAVIMDTYSNHNGEHNVTFLKSTFIFTIFVRDKNVFNAYDFIG
jgi:hypothetical protein